MLSMSWILSISSDKCCYIKPIRFIFVNSYEAHVDGRVGEDVVNHDGRAVGYQRQQRNKVGANKRRKLVYFPFRSFKRKRCLNISSLARFIKSKFLYIISHLSGTTTSIAE